MLAADVIYRQDEAALRRAEAEAEADASSASSSPEPGFELGSRSGSFSSASSDAAGAGHSEDEDPRRADQIRVLDPSEHYRPEEQYKDLELHGKAAADFRRYSLDDEDHIQRRVKLTYYQMHKNQTVEFVRGRLAKWTRFDHAQLTIMEALEKLNDLVDESDPDSDLPNIVHAFQTAERIRAVHPDKGWLQLTGLIHDLGKILVLFGEAQWAVVGDTYPVGCAFAPSIVYREHSFAECPDLRDKRYNTRLGIYAPNCGLDRVLFSWGHDEYMARVLANHEQCTLPPEALRIIRLHSFYPWHSAGDYLHLCEERDLETLELIREFNKFDLYTKSAPVPDIAALAPYYQRLIDQYVPGKLRW